MEISDELLAEVGFVIRSKNRTKVMKSLQGEVKIPSMIAVETGIITNHVSNNLKDLKDHGLVECINPEAKKGRLYRLTDNGNKIVDKLDYFQV